MLFSIHPRVTIYFCSSASRVIPTWRRARPAGSRDSHVQNSDKTRAPAAVSVSVVREFVVRGLVFVSHAFTLCEAPWHHRRVSGRNTRTLGGNWAYTHPCASLSLPMVQRHAAWRWQIRALALPSPSPSSTTEINEGTEINEKSVKRSQEFCTASMISTSSPD